MNICSYSAFYYIHRTPSPGSFPMLPFSFTPDGNRCFLNPTTPSIVSNDASQMFNMMFLGTSGNENSVLSFTDFSVNQLSSNKKCVNEEEINGKG